MQKTLGGDRLGSGKKMNVHLHGYERSTHDLSYLWRSTMSAGTLVPFMSMPALPGDTFDIDLDVDIKTHPTIGPLFGSYKIQLDVFLAPIRLYQGQLHNNKLGIGLKMSEVKLPLITLNAPAWTTEQEAALPDLDNSQINPSCILAYLGLRGIGYNTDTPQLRSFNVLALLMYWDTYKNYYANKQEEIGAVIHAQTVPIVQSVDEVDIATSGGSVIVPQYPATVDGGTWQQPNHLQVDYTGATPLPSQIILYVTAPFVGTISLAEASRIIDDNGTHLDATISAKYTYLTIESWDYIDAANLPQIPPTVVTFPLSNLDDIRESILHNTSNIAWDVREDVDYPPLVWLIQAPSNVPNILNTQEGLAIKTYQSDLFNNWLNTETIDGAGGISEITAISTAGGSFTIDTLNLSRKVYDMLNRIAVSGGTYDDWLDATYTHDRYVRCESPMYMGGLIRELVFQEVISNAEAGDGTQPLGTLAGKGVMGHKKKGGKVTIKVDEPSYILGIISLTPRLDYSQGNQWDMSLKTMDDFHKPALDEIGFQELITEQMAWWSTEWSIPPDSTWLTRSAGKQPAWINYMTNVNKVLGNFAIASNEMFMVLNRRYEKSAYPSGAIADLTTYIDPIKFNHIFANTSIDAQNFWAQIAVDITARRKMSAKIMPNL